MALSDNYLPTKVIGNGVTTVFTGTWNPLSASFIRIFLENATTGVQALQTQGVDYSFTFTTSGWSAVFAIAPPATEYVVGARITKQEQQTVYKTQRGFQGPVTEGSYDRLTAMMQEQQDDVDRSLTFKLGSTSSVTVPEPSASLILGWNAAATDLENVTPNSDTYLSVSTYMKTVLDDTTAAAARATLGAGEDVITARGDFIRGNSTGTTEKLVLGASGKILGSDGTDLLYIDKSPGENLLLNGALQQWQRGTGFSLSSTSVYTVDRFTVHAGNNNVTLQRVAGDNAQYAMRAQRDGGQTGTNPIQVGQPLLTSKSKPLAGKTVTATFSVKKGANFSSTSDILISRMSTGTGTDENRITSGYTGNVDDEQNNTLTGSTQTFTHTYTLPSGTNEVCFSLYYNPTGTAGTDDYIQVELIKLEVGNSSTDFVVPDPLDELQRCQAYYWEWSGGSSSRNLAQLTWYNTTSAAGMRAYPVEMRMAPSITITGNFSLLGGVGSIGAMGVDQINTTEVQISMNGGASGVTGESAVLRSNATGKVTFDSEI